MQIDNPFIFFDGWLAEAEASELNDHNAMALATADSAGAPSVRMVLLKGHGAELGDHGGFVFYTNMESRKANELRANSQAALLFHWKSQRRQVRVEGAITPVSEAEADAYFASRGRLSQLGAWASDQSRPLGSRETLEARLQSAEERFAGEDVMRPPYWSGFLLEPAAIEFWQDMPHRLHERWRLEWDAASRCWSRGMLFP